MLKTRDLEEKQKNFKATSSREGGPDEGTTDFIKGCLPFPRVGAGSPVQESTEHREGETRENL